MSNLDYKGNNTDYFYLDKREIEIKFLDKLCLKCGYRFKDISGLCQHCKNERKQVLVNKKKGDK